MSQYPRGEIGRRTGLKNRLPHGSEGSTPSVGTNNDVPKNFILPTIAALLAIIIYLL